MPKRDLDVAGAQGIVSGMAGRYATALFELALEANAIDSVRADLARFDALIAESPDLGRLIRSPVFSAEEQMNALTAILGKAGIGGLAAQFLKLVASNRRLFAVQGMIQGFNALVARHKGEVTAQVTLGGAAERGTSRGDQGHAQRRDQEGRSSRGQASTRPSSAA